VAIALAKMAGALPLPATVAELLKGVADPQSLEKLATEFKSTPDLAASARLLETAFEMRRKNKIPIDDRFLAFRELVDYKIKIGERNDVRLLVQALLDHLRQTPLAPVLLGGIDDALIKRRVGLERLAEELEAARFDPVAGEVRRFLQDLIRQRLRESVALQVRAGKSSGEYPTKSIA
jgi:hypothetical protein